VQSFPISSLKAMRHLKSAVEYLRIFPPILDREKHLYILYSRLPYLNPAKFFQHSIFNYFPEEVMKVSSLLLTTESNEPLPSEEWFK